MQKEILTPPHLIIALDFGGSGVKGIYQQLDQTTSHTLFIEPQIFPADLESLQEKTRGNLHNSDPENLSWIGIDSDYRAVGYLARERYLSTSALVQKKYLGAVYRALAAIWVVKQKLNLSNNFLISLAVLLPPGELEDAQRLFKLISKACSTGFETPTGTLKVKLVNFKCLPEGGGVALLHSLKKGSLIKQKTTAIVMIGYRNASLLINYRGMLDSGRTTNLGMVRLVELVQQKTSGLTMEALLKTISEGGSTFTPSKFYSLTDSWANAQSRQAEVDKIIEAIKRSRAEYLRALKEWLAEVLPDSVDEIVFCGGTADYLKSDLNGYFISTLLEWHGDFALQPTWEHQWLGNRLADVYGVFAFLSSFIASQPQQVC